MTNDERADSTEAQVGNVSHGDTLHRAPRKRKRDYDGTEPLECPELEAVAEFLATPEQFRETKTFADMATHFGVSRMTIYRWPRDEGVLMRAEYLLRQNQTKGDFVARLNWERIVMGQVKAAMRGSTGAAQFCEKRAWPPKPLLLKSASLAGALQFC